MRRARQNERHLDKGDKTVPVRDVTRRRLGYLSGKLSNEDNVK